MPKLAPVRASTLRPPKLPIHEITKRRPINVDDSDSDKYALKAGARARLAAVPYLVIGFSVGWLLSTVLTPDLMYESIAISGDSAAVGFVHDVFSRQGISRAGFHSRSFKLRLASLLRKTGKIAVAGVHHPYDDTDGNEVEALAEAGYEIYAFEPLQHYYEALRKLSERRPHWMVHLHKVALGDTSWGTIRLKHGSSHGKGSIEETVHRAQIDDYIAAVEEIDVLSVHIQGGELEVLQGARNLLHHGKHGNVRSLWIEISGCSAKTAELFSLLQSRYILFDFVPRGTLNSRNNKNGPVIPMGNGTLINRPHKHAQYLYWLCDAAKKAAFRWVETDIVAVRKDLVTTELLERFSTIANDALVASLAEMRALKRKKR